jgi:hypothetical protein
MNNLRSPGLIRATLVALGILGFGGLLAACDDDPFEEAGENIDDAADEIDDAF